jgi:hypothetical protein
MSGGVVQKVLWSGRKSVVTDLLEKILPFRPASKKAKGPTGSMAPGIASALPATTLAVIISSALKMKLKNRKSIRTASDCSVGSSEITSVVIMGTLTL